MRTRTDVRATEPVIPHNPDSSVTLLPAGTPVADGVIGLTDTAIFRPRVIEIDPALRERMCILQPGAPGERGAPYKMLRTQVLNRLDKLGANTLGIFSATAGEGKTLTAINLAIAIAADTARTALLVDFDLRNPGIARRFGHEPEMGVEDCLEQQGSLREAIFKVAGYERLSIAAARRRVESSSELLTSLRTGDLVAEMRERYANRVLLFDMPPVLQSDDALAFSKHLQAGLLVVGEGRAARDGVRRSLEILHDLTFVGTVLNGSRTRVDTYY